MARPSRNLDQVLLAAGRELLPQRGCAGLSVREVAERAGVNLGMFHYHFRTREVFLRAVLQQAYEEMFATLRLEADRGAPPVEGLRAALRVLGRFLRDNRPLLARVFADALGGEACAREFIRDNLPRHVAVLRRMYLAGRRGGALRAVAFEQALGLLAGALALPILAGGTIAASGMVGEARRRSLERTLLTDAAIDERIDLALAGLAQPAPRRKERRSA
ncbi:MAG TPA: helix-turn-helix domain-containing protein [Usitatibacter sp.]|nr:helix-turn-helix domain-containing protein [Usitatibacter sp.]